MRSSAEYDRDCALCEARIAEKVAMRTKDRIIHSEAEAVYVAAKKRARDLTKSLVEDQTVAA